jgi:hypothetical protein
MLKIINGMLTNPYNIQTLEAYLKRYFHEIIVLNEKKFKINSKYEDTNLLVEIDLDEKLKINKHVNSIQIEYQLPYVNIFLIFSNYLEIEDLKFKKFLVCFSLTSNRLAFFNNFLSVSIDKSLSLTSFDSDIIPYPKLFYPEYSFNLNLINI